MTEPMDANHATLMRRVAVAANLRNGTVDKRRDELNAYVVALLRQPNPQTEMELT